ncbi:phosphatase PAP2 family protein [Brevibacillus massiliensis]|jgi:undecaprenyl-diphosphatase|uniref:phosphatase PAP2 family protein n=1 Tax=Brevibacillus massiliensis TaxID=1118054 RepID=UPI00031445E7|nr:phosphatase PAP2 family protein [Brevibacillus massiliensis]
MDTGPRRVVWLGFLSTIGFALVAYLVARNATAPFDSLLSSAVQRYESLTLTELALTLSFIGSTKAAAVISVVVIAVLFFVLRHRSELVLFIAAVGGAALVNDFLKHLFQRERPTLHRLVEETGYSFPSGHSMGAFALYGILVFLLWKHIPSRIGRVLLLLFGAAMILGIGWSRIYLGVHYPSDVIGAYLASAVWLTVSIRVYQWYRERRMRRRRHFPGS